MLNHTDCSVMGTEQHYSGMKPYRKATVWHDSREPCMHVLVFVTGKQGLEGLQDQDKLISKQQAEESLSCYNVSFELKIQMLTLKMQNKGTHVGSFTCESRFILFLSGFLNKCWGRGWVKLVMNVFIGVFKCRVKPKCHACVVLMYAI